MKEPGEDNPVGALESGVLCPVEGWEDDVVSVESALGTEGLYCSWSGLPLTSGGSRLAQRTFRGGRVDSGT